MILALAIRPVSCQKGCTPQFSHSRGSILAACWSHFLHEIPTRALNHSFSLLAERQTASATSMATHPASRPPGRSLLALPAEIRLEIYSLLLVNYSYADSEARCCGQRQGDLRVPITIGSGPGTPELAILRTCKHVHDEAVWVLYTQNIFRTTSMVALRRLMSPSVGKATTRPSNASLVRSLVIEVAWFRIDESSSWNRTMSVLPKRLTGLRELIVIRRRPSSRFLEEGRMTPPIFNVEQCPENLGLMQAVSRMQGLERLAIKGINASTWPLDLQAKMTMLEA